jgi:SAM-dependent methyltransferase
VDTSKEWDRIFSGLDEKADGEDAWLESWRHVLEANRGSPVLDLGCGAGQDTRFLTELGFAVLAADFSDEALQITRRRAPAAKTQNVDLTRGLPFPDAHLGIIVAGLSLHYFPWHQTTKILDDIRRCLEPGGHLLARFDSTRDPYYLAAEKQKIENNFYLVGGMPKRFFDEQDVNALFEEGWELLEADERLTSRYGGEKLAWEVAARKAVSRTKG